MIKIHTARNNETFAPSAWKAGLSLLAVVALTGGVWFASLSGAQAAPATPGEMIQRHLPRNMTIANASDQQLLDAVCKAVRQHPGEAALLVRTAAGARQNLRTEILCMAIRCGRVSAADARDTRDCTWVLDVVREWINAQPSLASQLIESVSQCAPDCREALQSLGLGEGNFTNPPVNINPPPGSVGGGAGGNVCLVCHNGHEVQVACTDLEGFLKSHSGDTAGPCQPTPTTNP